MPDRPILLSPDGQFELTEDMKTVGKALGRLKFKERQLLAYAMDEFTLEEIAAKLRTTRCAVRQGIHRARKALQRELQNNEEGGE
jgi:RNA polymerase sigma factor (sigma-70 family)